jgi:ankyrin repeat protein
LDDLALRLRNELQSADPDSVAKLKDLFRMRSVSWDDGLAQEPSEIYGKDATLHLTSLHWFVSPEEYQSEITKAHKNDENFKEQESKIEKPHKTDINVKDILDWTPLHYTATAGSIGNVEELLTYRPDVNVQDVRGQTPLHLACRHNDNASIVQSLLREGADVSIRDTDGLSPLHQATAYGHTAVVESLIEAGADINVVDGLGNTPLLWAAFRGHLEVGKLLWNSVKLKLRDRNDGTALNLAAIAEVSDVRKKERLVKIFINQIKINKEARDRFGRTPLHAAAANGDEAVVKVLVRCGAEERPGMLRDLRPCISLSQMSTMLSRGCLLLS